MPVGAIAGSAVIGAGASIYSGNKAAKAQKNAAAQQAANERYFYDTTREDQAPYRAVGTGALGKLAQMYGVNYTDPTTVNWDAYVQGNPDAMANWNSLTPQQQKEFGSLQQFGQHHYETDGSRRDLAPYMVGGASPGGVADYGGFTASPGYQFRLDEGNKAIERSAAARGLLGSGATMKAIGRFSQGTASDEFERYANGLRSMAGLGQTSTQATSAAGSQAAGGISQAIGNAGNARASSYANMGASVNNGISNVMGAYLQGGLGGGGSTTFNPILSAGNFAQLNAGVGGIGSGGSVSHMMPSWYGGS